MHTHNDKPEAGTATNVLGGRLHGIDEHVAKAEKAAAGEGAGPEGLSRLDGRTGGISQWLCPGRWAVRVLDTGEWGCQVSV